MTNDEQWAESVKYSSAVWHFVERDGLFALYNHARELVLLTYDWPTLLRAYRERPLYVPPVRCPPQRMVRGIDLSQLDIDI